MNHRLYRIYNQLPNPLQNLFVTAYNILSYKRRMGGQYSHWLNHFRNNFNLSIDELQKEQLRRLKFLLEHAQKNSPYYSILFNEIDFSNFTSISDLQALPFLTKEDIRKNIDEIISGPKSKLKLAKTGGTTGKSLNVYYTYNNGQERFAMLDAFRGEFGYKLGKRTAWFSGKSLITARDIRKNRFWKTDYWYKVRYYSTFHIKDDYLKHYIHDLMKFKPEFMVGFPSSILEIARYGLKNGYEFPSGVIKAIFPTAETLTKEMRADIETFFQTRMYDQYASSEGAPFIFECKKGNLHMELQSGVFEVLDENDQPSQTGRLIVTSFTTEGTPLIRYDIGDSVTLEDPDKVCSCGNNNPMVKEILGRIDDYVYSPENGKINIVNIANAIKDVKGIVRYQVIQEELNSLMFMIVADNQIYNKDCETLVSK
ncbi:phenylacetate-coenzyme A ligase PaaK, adenylate-forming domain family, partial [Bacteroidales bacterium 6E]